MTEKKLIKKVVSFGVPWENSYGYVQAIQVRDTIYLSGQLSHDSDGAFVAPAELDEAGRPVDYSKMEEQFRQTYINAKKMLSEFGAALAQPVQLVEITFRAVVDRPAS